MKNTIGQGLLFIQNENLLVKVYTNSNYANSMVDRRSTSRYYTFLGSSVITWRRKKQKVVARFNAEDEVYAMAHGICEVIWVKRILEELKSLPRDSM